MAVMRLDAFGREEEKMFTTLAASSNHGRVPSAANRGFAIAQRIRPRRLGGVLAAFALLAMAVTPLASAHGAEARICLDRADMIDTLIADYGEQLTEVRDIKGKGLLEFHVSPNDGTWTALLTKGNGISCVLAVGEGIDPAKVMVLALGTKI
jgi:hypothetical protein